MAGYWRTGGDDNASQPERPERIEQPEQQSEKRPRFGDENTISDKALLSFFGYKSWEDLERDRANDPLDAEEYEPPADDEPETERDQPAEDDQPEQTRLWRTIAEEAGGEVKSYSSYTAMKRDLGSEPGKHLHHLVEQSQIDPKRSGFPVERVNSTDNVTRIPAEIHSQVTAHFNRKPLGADRIRRDLMDGKPWDYQHEYGANVLDSIMDKQQRSADDEPRS